MTTRIIRLLLWWNKNIPFLLLHTRDSTKYNYYSILHTDTFYMHTTAAIGARFSIYRGRNKGMINNGNKTEWRQIRSVIIRVINKIRYTSMITDWIGRHEVLLPINHKNYSFREKGNNQVTKKGEILHSECGQRRRKHSKVTGKNTVKSKCASTHT